MGEGCSKEIPVRLKSIGGAKPLVVTDQGIVNAGILKVITDILDAAKMKYAIYDKTIPNPTDNNVAEAFEVYKKEKCDSIVTLGGGSSHACGKGVGVVFRHGQTVRKVEEGAIVDALLEEIKDL